MYFIEGQGQVRAILSKKEEILHAFTQDICTELQVVFNAQLLHDKKCSCLINHLIFYIFNYGSYACLHQSRSTDRLYDLITPSVSCHVVHGRLWVQYQHEMKRSSYFVFVIKSTR